MNPIAALIDHTLLKPDSTRSDVMRMCREARDFEFASVCVNPYWIPLVASELAGTPVAPCSVIGFPLGAQRPFAKLGEARIALADGAREIDMVLNIGALRGGELDAVAGEIGEIADAAHHGGALLKVILETCLLTDEQKVAACKLAERAGADFVKTSTGFSTAGATAADVGLMRNSVSPKVRVKASGGIRTLRVLREMVEAGASRIGTSSGVSIMAESRTAGEASFQPNDVREASGSY